MKKLIVLLLWLVGSPVIAQHAFENEIRAYEKQDSLSMPKPGQILFLGSSSFRIWKSFNQDLAGIPAVNRGFGGSTLLDALYYFDRMLVKYQPSWVFLYEGDNDLTKGQTPEEISNEFIDFSNRLAKSLPKTKLVFVSVRPSLARIALVSQQKELNNRIIEFSKTQRNRYVLDMHSPFYLADGSLMQDIFIADKLHLNDKGYQIFAGKIREYIKSTIKW